MSQVLAWEFWAVILSYFDPTFTVPTSCHQVLRPCIFSPGSFPYCSWGFYMPFTIFNLCSWITYVHKVCQTYKIITGSGLKLFHWPAEQNAIRLTRSRKKIQNYLTFGFCNACSISKVLRFMQTFLSLYIWTRVKGDLASNSIFTYWFHFLNALFYIGFPASLLCQLSKNSHSCGCLRVWSREPALRPWGAFLASNFILITLYHSWPSSLTDFESFHLYPNLINTLDWEVGPMWSLSKNDLGYWTSRQGSRRTPKPAYPDPEWCDFCLPLNYAQWERGGPYCLMRSH